MKNFVILLFTFQQSKLQAYWDHLTCVARVSMGFPRCGSVSSPFGHTKLRQEQKYFALVQVGLARSEGNLNSSTVVFFAVGLLP